MELSKSMSDDPILVLCLDDEKSVLNSLGRLLRQNGIKAELFESGLEALERVREVSFDVIISDMRMPKMDGAEFLTNAKAISPDARRILLTGYSDIEDTINAINGGGIHGYIQKPWKNEHLILEINKAAELSKLKKQNDELQNKVKAQNAELKELNSNLESLVEKRTTQIRQVLKQLEAANENEKKEHRSTVELLYNFINANPHLDADKAKNIAKVCFQLAKALSLSSEVADMTRMAGYLSQVGLLAMDPSLYAKPFHELDPEKKKVYLTHPSTAQLMLMPAQHLSDVAEAIYSQFEKYNGQGVPKGLKGKDIPIGAQILAVARDYIEHLYQSQRPMSERKENALEIIKMYGGSFYHPKIVEALLSVLSKDQVESEKVGSMSILTAQQLKPGMELGLAMHSAQGIMLLPKGHVLTESSISKLQQLETQRPNPFRIMIVDN
ncbi:two-component system response regulator [Pseudoalteromonas luteoviolacea]|uniref:Two-component system response regulator n=2 Tax=Pseudoalteromonas luteoviolacea TaxID=43657 RepID=A0A1C0TIZ7_9GAMM|nr:HD domain-containing phosphohydrolase [Pseudoalteromonas luteoviolacea]MBQ4810500.1 response regulator [Pseudoalteromonas luteoviolacea]OCQ18288.1 two-component system response regulator [Pseudoalteromonas luteoviolacea]